MAKARPSAAESSGRFTSDRTGTYLSLCLERLLFTIAHHPLEHRHRGRRRRHMTSCQHDPLVSEGPRRRKRYQAAWPSRARSRPTVDAAGASGGNSTRLDERLHVVSTYANAAFTHRPRQASLLDHFADRLAAEARKCTSSLGIEPVRTVAPRCRSPRPAGQGLHLRVRLWESLLRR
jgi:hypothetical protein